MRWTAAAAAFCLSAAVGFRAALRLQKRARTLELLVLLLERMELELGYVQAGLPDMLLRLETETPFCSFGLLKVCCARLQAGEDLPGAWCAGVDSLGALLKSWESVRLRQAGTLLGTTDLCGQQKLFSGLLLFLRQRRELSLQQSAAGGRLYRICGLCLGCVLFIMIL